MASSQYLFAYGTLKSDQPEHSQHCQPPPLSITPAKIRGHLWQLREGYPILQVDPSCVLLDASEDSVADWKRAEEIRSAHPPPAAANEQTWIHGELFEYPLAAGVLRKADLWENFVPGVRSPYQRRLLWIRDDGGADRIAWAYVCYAPPNWSVMLNKDCW